MCHRHMIGFQGFKVISTAMLPPDDFKMLNNVKANTHQNYDVQAKVMKQYNIAVTVNIRIAHR